MSDVLQKALLAQLRRANENQALIQNTVKDFEFIEATMTEHRTAAGHVRVNTHLTTDGQNAKLGRLSETTAGTLSGGLYSRNKN